MTFRATAAGAAARAATRAAAGGTGTGSGRRSGAVPVYDWTANVSCVGRRSAAGAAAATAAAVEGVADGEVDVGGEVQVLVRDMDKDNFQYAVWIDESISRSMVNGWIDP